MSDNDCAQNKNLGTDFAQAVNKIPVLRFQKEPVTHIEELYIKYPQGGEYGWYAFVKVAGTFAYWDINSKTWELLSQGDLQTILGADIGELKEGDVPVWDETQGKFVIVNISVIGTEDY